MTKSEMLSTAAPRTIEEIANRHGGLAILSDASSVPALAAVALITEWGSEAQIDAENALFEAVAFRMDPEAFAALQDECATNKGTSAENIALAVARIGLSSQTLDAMTDVYQAWCAAQSLPAESADELQARLWDTPEGTTERLAYLESFIEAWQTVQHEADAARLASMSDRTTPRVVCSSCDWTGTEEQGHPIADIFARVSPGEEMPSCECPECGALCHEVEEVAIPAAVTAPSALSVYRAALTLAADALTPPNSAEEKAALDAVKAALAL